MQHDRRQFLKLAVTSAVWIGAGNTIKTFAGSEFPAANKIMLRVAIASDGHFGQPQTAFETDHQEMVNWLNEEKKGRGVDFACINGDLIHNDPLLLASVKENWNKLSMPYYVTHGNHDMIDEQSWEKTWNYGWHYGFEKKGIAFIFLNTANEKGEYISPDIDKTMELLKQYEDKKQLFVFMHITPIKWTKHAISCPEVVAMFNKQSNLKAIFNGHDHDMDDVKENSNKHYFFDSHISGNWGTSYRGYRILEIMKNGNVLTYQLNPVDNKKINSKQL